MDTTVLKIRVDSALPLMNLMDLIKQYKQFIQRLKYIESLNSSIKRKTNSKGSFPTIDSAFKMLYMSTQEVQQKWERSSVRNWSKIYPQFCIFFSEVKDENLLSDSDDSGTHIKPFNWKR